MSKRVLIIEDEESIANVFKDQLTMGGGFEVTISNSGTEGMEILKTQKFDVILLDLVMPEIDGISVLIELKSHPETYNLAPVIILTNVTSDQTKEQAEKLGIVDYLIKTDIEPAGLIQKINHIVDAQPAAPAPAETTATPPVQV